MRRMHRPEHQCSKVFGLKVNLEGKTNSPCGQQNNAIKQDGVNEISGLEVDGAFSCNRTFQSVSNLEGHEQTIHRTEAVQCS